VYVYNIKVAHGLAKAAPEGGRPPEATQGRYAKVMHFDAISNDGPVERDVHVVWAVDTGRVDVDIVSAVGQ
jgi:hypothetical protein